MSKNNKRSDQNKSTGAAASAAAANAAAVKDGFFLYVVGEIFTKVKEALPQHLVAAQSPLQLSLEQNNVELITSFMGEQFLTWSFRWKIQAWQRFATRTVTLNV